MFLVARFLGLDEGELQYLQDCTDGWNTKIITVGDETTLVSEGRTKSLLHIVNVVSRFKYEELSLNKKAPQ